MLIFGFLLILLAAGVIAYMVAATTGMPDVRLDYGILNLELPPLWLYLAGLLTLAVAALGFWMVGAGARLKARRAKEVRELKRQAKQADRRVERAGDATVPRPTSVPGPARTQAPVTGSTTTAPGATTGPTTQGPTTTGPTPGPARPDGTLGRDVDGR
ncbi:hypothetical protein [Ornithinimicrobium tianjinense]|uniref:Lipopolysaccharide assembly protein A domain-containing protein n=1 Tax=Ornithinimicrobium tianjinense TaxID=1195761 RepID=A0A917F0Z5_9MICO|nr:hypothetical protein [Ornithinimicrobium tianjinense]GGF37532.1 hypothetical protein GCM10011366_01290 [Ornithinimicrobium tianjinense]